MSQLLNDYRVALLERSRNIRDGNQSMQWHFSQTMQLAEEAILCLYLLLVEAITQDVPLALPTSQTEQPPTSMQDLMQQCYELAEQLNREHLGLDQQLQITLKLVGCIAQLVGLHTEQAKHISTLRRSSLSKTEAMIRKCR
ncbi:MAG: hypothetical protein MUC48_12130 [Leptolyngbya sp. Prado105]|jgi:hypothetical protein|nr:hypothetical protein [Leptolyngbya sp. Prado105]